MKPRIEETKVIDTRSKGIRDDDQSGFMGAEDKKGKHTLKNTHQAHIRQGSEANARATFIEQSQQDQQDRAAANRKQTKQQNLVDYRRRIYQAFELAQSNYLQRKREANAGMISVDPLEQVIISKNEPDQFQTVRPLAHKFMDDKKPFHKFGSKLGVVKTRYFVLDDDNFIYYVDKNATVAKKSLPLGNASVMIENKDEVKPKKLKKWTSKSAQNRVAITLANQGNKKKYYVYSDDLNLLKSLMVKIKVAANPSLKEMLSNEVQKMNLIHKTCQFDQFWTYVKQIYEQREKRLVSFQLLGLHFVDIAAQNWQRNRKILKAVTGMADSLSEKGIMRNKRKITKREQKLQSSFRKGRAKATTERDMSINVSLMLHHRMQQLVNMIRTRKYRRSPGIQEEITKLYRQEVVGYRGPLVAFNRYDKDGKNISRQMLIDGDGRICFEPQNPGLMIFENLRPEKFQDLDFFENDYLTRLDLNEISMLATDQPGFYIEDNDDDETEYSIKIYGPVTKQAYLSKEKLNQTTEFAGLAPLRKIPQEMFTVTIHSLKFPTSWAIKNNGKGFIRLRLTQALGKDLEKNADDKDFEMDPNRQFTYLSFDVRLEFSEKQLREADEEVELKLAGVQFFLSPIHDRNKEKFVVEVLFFANICPVPTVVKDFMIENVWEADRKDDGIQLLQKDQRLTIDVSDSL